MVAVKHHLQTIKFTKLCQHIFTWNVRQFCDSDLSHVKCFYIRIGIHFYLVALWRFSVFFVSFRDTKATLQISKYHRPILQFLVKFCWLSTTKKHSLKIWRNHMHQCWPERSLQKHKTHSNEKTWVIQKIRYDTKKANDKQIINFNRNAKIYKTQTWIKFMVCYHAD